MLGAKLTSLANDIYTETLQKMNDINIPCTLQCIVIENVLSKFRDNALSAASEQAVIFEEELRNLKADIKAEEPHTEEEVKE